MPKASSQTAGASQAATNKAQGPGFKTAPNGTIIASSVSALMKLTVDPQMRTALTNAGAKLVIEIDASGTDVYIADRRNGSMIGGPEDLQKINGIRAFVIRERKESSSLEIGQRIKDVAYLTSLHLAGVTAGYVQPALESSFIAAVKPLIAVLEVIEKTEQKVRANQNATNREIIEEFLLNQIVRVRRAYVDVIEALVRGDDTKGLLAERVFRNGVSAYMHTKLINSSLVIERTQDLNRVVFPADPSKGLFLTLKEWRTAPFLTSQGRILARSTLVRALARSDRLVRSICRMSPDIDLNLVDNPQVASALKGRLPAIPHLEDLRYLTSAGGKVKSNGWKFPIVSMETPNGAVSALGLAVMRTYSANLQSIELIDDYYERVVPGAVSKAALTPLNNFYVQWEAALDENGFCAEHSALMCGQGTHMQRVTIRDWLTTELRLAIDGPIQKSLESALGIVYNDAGDEEAPRPLTPTPTGVAPAVAIAATENFTRALSEVEKAQALAWSSTTFPLRAGRMDKSRGEAAMTRLTSRSKELVKRVQRLSPHVAQSLTAWLRGFNAERLQDAAATLAMAKFDELFIEEGLDEAESLEPSEVGDWADEVNAQ